MSDNPATGMIQHMLSTFDTWLANPKVEDVLMQRPNEAFIQGGGTTECVAIDFTLLNQQALVFLAASMKRQNVGRSLPLLSADLPGGLRLQAVLPPCVRDGTVALAIRRGYSELADLDTLGERGLFAGTAPIRRGLSREDEALVALYHQANECRNPDTRRVAWTEFFKATMKAGKTHTLCGKVGSGKTTAASALANEIPSEDRVVTIQDADEWSKLPHRNRVDLFYSKGDQGASRVNANDLVEAALRLAMRWLFLQELRGAEAFSFLRARRSGHPGLTTFHADNVTSAFHTLALMVRQHPAAGNVEVPLIVDTLHELIDVVVHFHRPGGLFEVSEVWFGPAERAMGRAA